MPDESNKKPQNTEDEQPSGAPELSDVSEKSDKGETAAATEDASTAQAAVDESALDAETDTDTDPEQASEAEAPQNASDDQDNAKDDAKAAAPESEQKPGRLKHAWRAFWRHKKWTLPLLVLVIAAVILALPWTRYKVLGLALKRSFTISVTDSKTHTPVSAAEIKIDGQIVMTSSDGQATVQAKVGKDSAQISKEYYSDRTTNIFVGISTKHNTATILLNATGRQVPLTLTNKITGKPVVNAEIKILDTTTKTKVDGGATIVLPTGSQKQSAVISAPGFNTEHSEVLVTSKVVQANKFSLTPAGSVYFLSNASGKIDLESANLDDTNQKTILAGTGHEDTNNTTLSISSDGKYGVLLANRDGGQNPKLYALDTGTNKTSTFDEGDANFTTVGWSGHNFVYVAYRQNIPNWKPDGIVLKSYDADSGKLTTLDQNAAVGTSDSDYASQSFAGTTVIGDTVLYQKIWTSSYYDQTRLQGKKDSFMSVPAAGGKSQDLKDITLLANTNVYINALQPEPATLYYDVHSGTGDTYYTYRNNSVTVDNTITQSDFNKTYPLYIASPDGSKTFWSEKRDGKNTLFVGDANGNNAHQIASLSEYAPYGWFSNQYLLVGKSNSELYVMPVGGLSGTQKPLKIGNYFTASQSYYGM